MDTQTIDIRVDNVALALEVGERYHYGFKVLGKLGMIDKPVVMDDFTFTPLNSDSTLKPWVWDILWILKSEGVEIQQVIIGHEIETKPIAEPIVEPEIKPRPMEPITLPKVDWGLVGKIGLAALGTAVVVAAGMAVAFMIALAYMVDPCCVIVVEDTWVLCAVWYD